MPIINADILVWARETADLSVEEAAKKLSINDAYGKTPSERLAELESGQKDPTRAMLKKMSKQYHRPLLTFYLAEPPAKGDRGEDFRKLPSIKSSKNEALLDALIRDVLARQSLFRSALIDEEEENEVRLDFIDSKSTNDGVENVLQSIKDYLKFDLEEFRKKNKISDAFKILRKKVEDIGVYVLLLGNLGSHHTNLDVETFRGFALSDPYAPFVIINDQDSRSAWSFTLLHELTHLFLGQTGVSGAYPFTQIEKFCNDVASEFLLPSQELDLFEHIHQLSDDEIIEEINKFSRKRNISRSMVAYRIYRANLINKDRWLYLHRTFNNQWHQTQKIQRKNVRKSTGAPSYYVVRRHRLGSAILKTTKRFMGTGALTTTKASTVLGVKPKNVQKLLETTT